MRRQLTLCCIGLLLLCRPTVAQQIIFNHLNVENGLSQNSVLAITQDSRGFMWFGNRYGLNRYDGHNFRLYKFSAGDTATISSDYILCLLPAPGQSLWVGTANGLCRYDAPNDVFHRVSLNTKGTPESDHSVNCLFEDREGTLWIGTSTGLFAGKEGGPFISFGALTGDNIRALFEDAEGSLWVGTSNGLTRLRRQNGKYSQETFRHTGTGSLSDDFVTTIIEDKLHRLWVGTQNGGLDVFDPSNGSFSTYQRNAAGTGGVVSNNIRKIILDKEGKLWIGTLEGLSILDPVTLRSTAYQHDPSNRRSLSQNSIYSLFQDAGGSIWIGTYFGGVNITYSYKTPFAIYETIPYASSISNNVVSAFAEDRQHNLWIGTEGGGLNYFDRASGRFISYKNSPGDPFSLGSNLVKTVFLDREGELWVGTHGGGLNWFDPASRRFTRFLYRENDPGTLASEIAAVMEDDQGRLWVGTQAGVQIFRHAHGALMPYPEDTGQAVLQGKSVKVIFEDSKKDIWVATTAGLYRLGAGKNSFEPVLINKGSASVNANFINCLQEDSKGRIWIGMYYEGLVRYDDSTRKTVVYTEKDGLPNNNVVGILEDKTGSLWLSTDNGLSRFDPASGVFNNYTASDGLASNEFNYNSYFKDSKGEMFFGGYSGFTGFFPDRIETNNHIAPIVFTGLRLFNSTVAIGGKDGLLKKDISVTKDIVFHHDQGVFSIEFALLNFVKSNKNRYVYRLVGFEKNGNEVTSTSATYTNLPSGDYTFEVIGANNDGYWSPAASLHIRVLPPFWKTWWAYTLYVLAFAALLFLIVRYFFLRELLKREDALHQAKLNFFTNISHEIRTHLALIIGPVEKLLLGRKEEEDRRQLKHIKKNSESLLQLVDELMDFRKAESGNLALHVSPVNVVAFVEDIYASFLGLSAARGIRMELIAGMAGIEVYFDKEQMEKVFFNLLTNAFKFTPDGGTIDVVIGESGNQVEVKVVDNGKGIAPENLDKLFLNYYQENDYGVQNTGYGIGLALSKSIVDLHKGRLTVASSSHTCFTVTLLKGRGHFTAEQLKPVMGVAPLAPGGEPGTTERDGRQTPQAGETNPAGGAERELRYTLLLVEDNDDLRAFIRESLQPQYRILESRDGMSGLDTAVESIPDLVISDVMMPGMDGYELCGRLKSDARTSHIPIILLTAKTSTANQLSGLEMGADSYLAKPFHMPVLELQIRNLLASRETMRQKFSRELTLQPSNIIIPSMDEQWLEKAIRFIEENMDDGAFGVPSLSTHMAMSQPVLYKKIKALTDMSVNDFIKHIRLKRAAMLLKQGRFTVYEVAYTVGYSDRKYFSKEFKKQFGCTPSEYAETGEDQQV